MSILVDDVVVNPKDVDASNVEASLSEAGIEIIGADFGESVKKGQEVKTAAGVVMVSREPQTRTITLKLKVRPEAEVTLPEAAARLETIVAHLQESDSWIRRDFHVGGDFGSILYHITGEVSFGDFAGWQVGASPDVTLTMVADYACYSTEEAEHGPFKSGGKRHCEYTLPASDSTAKGLKRIRVTNEGEEDLRGLIWAEECRDAPADLEDPTAQLAYEAVELTPMGGAAISGVAPEVRAVGTVASAAAAISPGLPAGTEVGDLLLMVAESGGPTASTEATKALTAAGWSSPPAPYAAQVKGNTRLTILYRIATGSDPTITNDTGDHQVARIIGIKAGTFDPDEPFNTAGVGTQIATKSVSIPGATTTRHNCLIVACASGDLPDATGTAEFGAATNASLSSLTERIDNTGTAGDGGAIYAVTGLKAAAGAYSATTCTAVTEAQRGVISLAINPPASYVEHKELTAGWLTILSSEIVGEGHMTHRGPRRLWMRVQQPSGEAGDVQLRLYWRALGTGRWEERNAIVPTYAVGSDILIDLDECRPQDAVVGEQRWEFKLLARAPGGSGVVRVRDVYPLPTEQYMVVREPYEAPAADLQQQKSPGTAENDASVGGAAWSNLTNVKASDDSRATVTLTSPESATSQLLKVANLGFGLPEGATPVEFVVGVEWSRTGEPVLLFVSLVKNGEFLGGPSPKTQIDYSAPTTDTIRLFKFSAAGWTVGDINAANFGAAVQAGLNVAFSGTARIDHIFIGVYYAPAATNDQLCFAGRSLELASDGVRRQARDDDVWGAAMPDGFLPYDTPGDVQGRPSQGILIGSTGDLDELPDSGENALSTLVRRRAGHQYARALGE